MEKQLKCVLLLPLQEMALRKVAVLLWSGEERLTSYHPSIIRYPEIKDKVSKLGLPESLAKKMLDLVRPIGLEIRRWIEFHSQRSLYKKNYLPPWIKLCWTTVGGIDYRRTAEELVRCEEMSVELRYEIACDYCLEDWIPLLWEELPEERKDYFSGGKVYLFDLQFYWPHILKGKQYKLKDLWMWWNSHLISFNQFAFEESAEEGYIFSSEHFFQKLTRKEREASLMRTVRFLLADSSLIPPWGIWYLLTLMTPEERMEFVKAHPMSTLKALLRSPLQDLFWENWNLILTFIPPSDYDQLLSVLFKEYELSPKFFQKFFILSPLAFRKECLYRNIFGKSFMSRFILFEDSESLKVLFRNIEAADRVELVCHPDTLGSFHEEILVGRWHMVEVCLREATLSEVDRKRLEKAFIGFMRQNQFNWEDPIFKRFFEFLDDTHESADKQKKARKRKLCPE